MNLEVNLPILSELLEQIQIVLGKEFVGLYLHGSLALGDFDLVKSDIDFAVVTGNHLEAEMISKLKTLHEKLLEVHPETASMLEGAYIPSSMVRRHDFRAPAIPTFTVMRSILRNSSRIGF